MPQRQYTVEGWGGESLITAVDSFTDLASYITNDGEVVMRLGTGCMSF